MSQQRTTKQFEAIRKAIDSAGRPLSIEEIHDVASRTVETLGQRTVYRVYELASIASKHHHHFHCKACDRFFDVDGCPGGLKKMVPKGFVLEHHDLTLSGLCAARA